MTFTTEEVKRIVGYSLFTGDFGTPDDRRLRDQVLVAAKAHQCDNCLQPVQRGEQHRCHVGKYDNQVRQYRFCNACCRAMLALDESFDRRWVAGPR